MYQLSKHAKNRYFERFGRQDIKVILERAKKSRYYKTDNNGSEHRLWGAICFVIVADTIVTIKKYKI